MIPDDGPHVVGGLKFERRSGRWPYVVLKDHLHSWQKPPKGGSQGKIESNNKALATVSPGGVTLHRDYAWDGSSGPGVEDTLFCMRASALHDVWCQAMTKGFYPNRLGNWRRGASMYRTICREDGMASWRAWGRYFGILVYWPLRALKGRSV